MSLQVRVLIEVADSTSPSEPWVRQEQTETVMPAVADGPATDLVALGGSVLSRMVSDLGERAGEQLTQVAELAAAANL